MYDKWRKSVKVKDGMLTSSYYERQLRSIRLYLNLIIRLFNICLVSSKSFALL